MAPHYRPQAHRPALSDNDHVFLLHRGFLRVADPAGTANPGRGSSTGGYLQQAVHHAWAGDGLLFPDPGSSCGPGEFSDSHDDWGEGPCVSADKPAELVSARHRRRADDVHNPNRRSRHRVDLLYPTEHAVFEYPCRNRSFGDLDRKSVV